MSKSKKKKTTIQRRDHTQAGAELPLFDRRALEKSMFDIGKILREREFESIDEINAFLEATLASGEPLSAPNRTPLEEAQDIMYEAWSASGARRVRLAHKALSVSKDCADVYVLLAEEVAKTPQEAMQLYEQGVKAGERALGSEVFEEGVGHFWGILETRPYMRARAGLADCLWVTGEHQQAIEHYQDMLRLNPGDNQGIRYLLIRCLLYTNDDDAVQALLDQYPDDASAEWTYTRALLAFRRAGSGRTATARLKEAISYNPFVPPYLLGKKRLPRHLPPYAGFGDENEAVHYAVEARTIWGRDPEALAWLEKTAATFHADDA